MNKKEVLELKRRFKKEAATFTRVCGCYVDGNHNKVCKFGNTFLNLEEDEFYKLTDFIVISVNVTATHARKR